MKRCPYCDERIQNGAIFCRYCQRELPPESAKDPTHEHRGLSKTQKLVLIITPSVLLVLVLAWVLIFGKGDVSALAQINGEDIHEWTNSNNAYEFKEGWLVADGKNEDESDRYRIIFDAPLDHQIEDYLEISYTGILRSDGDPQPGRGISVVLVGGKYGYDLNLQKGYVQGAPTNQHSISLSFRDGVSNYDLITTDFEPDYDEQYRIKAVRSASAWYLFVDEEFVGKTDDPINLQRIDKIHMPLTGSVMVSDIHVKTNNNQNDMAYLAQFKRDCKISFYTEDMQNGSQYYFVNEDGEHLQKIDEQERGVYWCSFSPTHDRAVCIRYDDENESELFTYDVIATDGNQYYGSLQWENEKQITFNDCMDDYPDWSPKGDQIVYSSVCGGHFDLYLINPEGGEITQLTDDNTYNINPKWSPDGEKIAFASRRYHGYYAIYILDINSMEQTQITFDDSNNWWPVWTSDGQRIFFMSDRDGDDEVFMMDMDGSNQVNISNNDLTDSGLILVCSE